MSVKTWLGGTLQLTVTFPSCPGEDLIWDLQMSGPQAAPESIELWWGSHAGQEFISPGDTYIPGVWALGVSSGSQYHICNSTFRKEDRQKEPLSTNTEGTVWKWYASLLVTSPCPELSYMVTLRSQGGWEMRFLTGWPCVQLKIRNYIIKVKGESGY